MPQPRPWLDEIIDALEELGGQGSLADIYATIANRKIMDFEANPNWDAAVRRTIEQHSSDSKVFTGNLEDDLFCAPKAYGMRNEIIARRLYGMKALQQPFPHDRSLAFNFVETLLDRDKRACHGMCSRTA